MDKNKESENKETARSYKILVYGIDKMGLDLPSEEIKSRNYCLAFEPFNTSKRFNDFDGVILFQGIFESFKFKTNYIGNSYHIHFCYHDELDKRKKESEILLKKGGFVCFLLNHKFIDLLARDNYLYTDLAKCYLNYDRLDRHNYESRTTNVRCVQSEFEGFLNLSGAANTYFNIWNDNIQYRPIAKVSNSIVGMILWNDRFFIPSLVPENTPERVEEYFKLLADAVTSSCNKLIYSIPDWIDKFQFSKEKTLLDEKLKINKHIERINTKLNIYQRFKYVLLSTGDQLVEAVNEVLSKGFGFATDTFDEFREDIKIIDSKGNPIIFAEIKGVNAGIKREDINQADSHRERAGLSGKFPSLLIMNTGIKKSRTLAEKDASVSQEQIVHAVNLNILIIRTLDLLNLLKMFEEKKIFKKEIINIFKKGSGWLKVTDKKYEIIK